MNLSLEKTLRIFHGASTVLLGVAFACAWFQAPIAAALKLEGGLSFHVAFAVGALFVALFSHLFVMFYFIGTGIWLRDNAQGLVARNKKAAFEIWALYEKANKLKGPTFPFISLFLVFATFTFILGGATNVGAIAPWVHPTLATLTVLVALIGMKFIFGALTKNLALLDSCSGILSQSEVQTK